MRVRHWFPFPSVLGLYLLLGCASTRLTALKNPQAPPQQYGRILAVFPLEDLEFRRQAEERLVEGTGGQMVPSYTLLFPGTELTEEYLLTVISENEIDAVLIISLVEEGISSEYVPEEHESETSCVLWSVTEGCLATKTETSTSGGYTLDKPWAEFTVNLLDIGQGEVVWYATAKTGGNIFADQRDLFLSLSEKVTEELRREGIIR